MVVTLSGIIASTEPSASGHLQQSARRDTVKQYLVTMALYAWSIYSDLCWKVKNAAVRGWPMGVSWHRAAWLAVAGVHTLGNQPARAVEPTWGCSPWRRRTCSWNRW